MAFVTPPTFVAGDPLAADDLNILGADIEYLKDITDGVTFSGTLVTRNANQSIPNNTDTFITFDTENWDYGGWYSSGSKVIVPAGAIPGGYSTIAIELVAVVKFASNTAGSRLARTTQNGSSTGYNQIGALGGGDPTIVILPLLYTISAAAAEIQLQVWQNSGGALNVTQAFLTVVRKGPAS